MQRQLIDFAKTPREKILKAILVNGSSTISSLSKELQISPKDVRYHALRLVQDKKLEMTVESEEPLFKILIEAPVI
jgi:predicted ArsR family transcriptional regulator